MAQVGARPASPLTLLREHAEALRRLLDGEEVTVSGRYVHLDRVRLDWPPVPGTPLYVGGTGPRTLELAGEVGDGILLGSELSVAAGGRLGGRGAPRLGLGTPRCRSSPTCWSPPATPAPSRMTCATSPRSASRPWCSSPREDEPDLEGFVEFVGRDVRAALAG